VKQLQSQEIQTHSGIVSGKAKLSTSYADTTKKLSDIQDTRQQATAPSYDKRSVCHADYLCWPESYQVAQRKIYVRSLNTQAMSIPQNIPEEARSCFNTSNCRYIFLYSARPPIIAAGSFAKLISPKYNGEVEPVKVNYHLKCFMYGLDDEDLRQER
jgi:hypothetical protein